MLLTILFYAKPNGLNPCVPDEVEKLMPVPDVVLLLFNTAVEGLLFTRCSI